MHSITISGTVIPSMYRMRRLCIRLSDAALPSIYREGTGEKGDSRGTGAGHFVRVFALYASIRRGIIPRHNQSERWRQRVMHKFFLQPEAAELRAAVRLRTMLPCMPAPI